MEPRVPAAGFASKTPSPADTAIRPTGGGLCFSPEAAMGNNAAAQHNKRNTRIMFSFNTGFRHAQVQRRGSGSGNPSGGTPHDLEHKLQGHPFEENGE